VKAMKLISYNRDFNSGSAAGVLRELISRVEFNPSTWRRVGEVLANDSYRDSAFYSIEKGAVSRLILMNDLKLSKVSSTRARRNE